MTTKRKKKTVKKQAAPKAPNHDKALREQLKDLLTWHDAHADWKAALADLPVEKRGEKAAGLPHTLWELLEHVRITQRDIFDFCTNPKYKAPSGLRDIGRRRLRRRTNRRGIRPSALSLPTRRRWRS
jgi:hypothetical protein